VNFGAAGLFASKNNVGRFSELHIDLNSENSAQQRLKLVKFTFS